MPLSDSEKERYLRHLSVQGWDQEKLKCARVLVQGVGGLGSASALYLTVAGVGRLRLCDGDRVGRSDLNRQILYCEESIGNLKVEEAKKRLVSINPDIEVETVVEFIDRKSVGEVTKDCDLIVDGLDNIESRFILNEQCVKMQIPYMYGAVKEWKGFVGLFHPPHTACLACVMPGDHGKTDAPPVAGVTPGTIALLQATETLKFIMGAEPTLLGRMLVYDGRDFSFDIVGIEKDKSCPHCST